MNTVDHQLLLFITLIALLYSSVGHAGASGYIAVLSLAGWAPQQIRPLALILNIFVACVATFKFYRAGYFRPRLFLPFALPAIPASALGGYLKLSVNVMSSLIGVVLLFSAVWLLIGKREPEVVKAPRLAVSLATGALLGFLAGLSGTGGGIFLSPVMLFSRWAKLKEISATVAPFILCNSAAGLWGMNASGISFDLNWLWCVVASLLGGLIGSTLGVKVLPVRGIQFMLALVLLIAGTKLLLFSS